MRAPHPPWCLAPCATERWRCYRRARACAGQYAGGHEHLQRIERENTIASAINQINAGNFKAPDAALSALLDAQPDHYQALVARGTCRALAGSQKPSELRKAENDFSRAIAVFPDLADVWKRRSQARAALGDFAGAVSDLQDCLKKCVALLATLGASMYDAVCSIHGASALEQEQQWHRCICMRWQTVRGAVQVHL